MDERFKSNKQWARTESTPLSKNHTAFVKSLTQRHQAGKHSESYGILVSMAMLTCEVVEDSFQIRPQSP